MAPPARRNHSGRTCPDGFMAGEDGGRGQRRLGEHRHDADDVVPPCAGRPAGRAREPRRGGSPQGSKSSHPDVGSSGPGTDRPAYGVGRAGDGGGGTVRAGAQSSRRSRRPGALPGGSAARGRRSRRHRDRPPAAGNLRRPHALRPVVGPLVPPVRGTEIRGALAGAGGRPVDRRAQGCAARGGQGCSARLCQGLEGHAVRDLRDDRRRHGDGQGLARGSRRGRRRPGGDGTGHRRQLPLGRHRLPVLAAPRGRPRCCGMDVARARAERHRGGHAERRLGATRSRPPAGSREPAGQSLRHNGLAGRRERHAG
jgi:hypothetical protein